MKFTFFLLITLFGLSTFGQERYYLLPTSDANEAAYRAAIASNDFLDISIEKGELNGVFKNGKFMGFYGVLNTSIGFVKGFRYRMALGYLQRDVLTDQRFIDYTQALADGKTFYFYPDVLASPKWHFLEISGEGERTLHFVRKH